jgi:hypothetical protein
MTKISPAGYKTKERISEISGDIRVKQTACIFGLNNMFSWSNDGELSPG